ncbi:MAG: Xaa-Pro peptidase family protein [Marinilabiliaceae bacterium]|nr:Xaa-Pro peptidase family protein [Marinilabiliaceae bacterium]
MGETITKQEVKIRVKRLQNELQKIEMDCCLISSNVNIFYLTGMIFSGYLYVPAEGELHYFVKRPEGIVCENVDYIYKPEQIPNLLKNKGLKLPETLLLEADELVYSEYIRLHSVFLPKRTGNATTLLRGLRSIKTQFEIEQLKISAKKHCEVYSEIKKCYRKGISDLDLQIEIEYIMRQRGSIGIFRAFGSNMDNFMGTVLAGENAAAPAPYDFALGGAGNSAMPIGANGTILKDGMTVMVDMAGNFSPYITDMSRVFSVGKIDQKAINAHNVSLLIHNELKNIAKPGFSCADLYNETYKIVEKENLSPYFMGTMQQAKFVGHGIGLQINEPPVLSPRSKEILQKNMVFAFEPKFVIPEIGAVGIENSYLVTDSGIENLTIFEENIIPFQ